MIGKKKIWITLLLLFFVGVTIYPMAVSHAAGLVPCGGLKEPQCSLCFLVQGFKNLVDFFLKLLTFVFLFSIAAAGLIYVISTGNEGMIKTAKSFLTATFIGFAMTLGAWLIVNIVMYTMLPTDLKANLSIEKWNDFKCQ